MVFLLTGISVFLAPVLKVPVRQAGRGRAIIIIINTVRTDTG